MCECTIGDRGKTTLRETETTLGGTRPQRGSQAVSRLGLLPFHRRGEKGDEKGRVREGGTDCGRKNWKKRGG